MASQQHPSPTSNFSLPPTPLFFQLPKPITNHVARRKATPRLTFPFRWSTASGKLSLFLWPFDRLLTQLSVLRTTLGENSANRVSDTLLPVPDPSITLRMQHSNTGSGGSPSAVSLRVPDSNTGGGGSPSAVSPRVPDSNIGSAGSPSIPSPLPIPEPSVTLIVPDSKTGNAGSPSA